MAESDKQAGLEVAVSDGPIASPVQSPKTFATSNTTHSDLEAAEAESYKEKVQRNVPEARYICGLRSTTFWILIIVIVVILAAGIGGGVGGALANNPPDKSAEKHNSIPSKHATATPSSTSISPYPTAGLAPHDPPPQGCNETYAGSFRLQYANTSDNEPLGYITCKGAPCIYTLTNSVLLKDGNLTWFIGYDSSFRWAYNPLGLKKSHPLYTEGFSHCRNGTLALGGSTVWYFCNDAFYLEWQRPLCLSVFFEISS